MKNTFKLFGIIALAAIIGFGVTACGGDDDNGGSGGSPFNGTWVNEADATDTITINNPNWTRTKGSDLSGILHYDSAPSPDSPNIRDNSGSNIGEAKIVSGKLHWDIGWAGAVIFSKGTSGGNNGGNNGGKSAGANVSAPALNTKTQNSITVYAVTAPSNGQTVEYGRNSTNTAPSTWQDGTTFSSLTADTTYYIFARSKENASYNAGTPSVGLQVKTDAAAAPVILSLDKIDEETFTMTVSGATWNPDTYLAYYLLLNGDYYYFDEERTSDTVITYTMNEEYSSFTGTLEFTYNSYIQGSGYYTDYLLSGVASQATITVNPNKSSVTFSGGNNGGGNGGGNLISAYRNTTWSNGDITIAFGTDEVTISGDSGFNGTYTIPEVRNDIPPFNRFYSFTSVIGNKSFYIYVISDGSGVILSPSSGDDYMGFEIQ